MRVRRFLLEKNEDISFDKLHGGQEHLAFQTIFFCIIKTMRTDLGLQSMGFAYEECSLWWTIISTSVAPNAAYLHDTYISP